MWKITTSFGDNISSTKLVKISNDSLYAIILNRNRVFAINDIERISIFNSNINQMMLLGAIIGGAGGLACDTYLTGNNKIDFQKNGVLYTIAGMIGGTFLGHILSTNSTVDLSIMPHEDKKEILDSMILLE